MGVFGVGGQESALPPAEYILSESQPKVHFKIILSEYEMTLEFNPYGQFSGPVTQRDFWKFNPKTSLVETQLRLRILKFYPQIEVYVNNSKWHMPI